MMGCAGGNTAVLRGREGKLLIDAGFPGARSKIADALASIRSDPIKHLTNTHWHFDHTGGNEWLHSAGAVKLFNGRQQRRHAPRYQVNLAKVTDKMIVIPGHGAVGDKSQLAFCRYLLVGTRDRVAALKKQGKSLDEIVAATPTAATDAKWATALGALRTSSETFSRAFDTGCERVTEASVGLVPRNALVLIEPINSGWSTRKLQRDGDVGNE